MSAPTAAVPVRGRRSFADLSVNVKILVAVAAMALTAAAVAATAISGMARMQAASDYLYSQTLVPITDLDKAQTSMFKMRLNLVDASTSDAPAEIGTLLSASRAQDAVFDQAFAAYTATDMTGREKAVAQVNDSMVKYPRAARGQTGSSRRSQRRRGLRPAPRRRGASHRCRAGTRPQRTSQNRDHGRPGTERFIARRIQPLPYRSNRCVARRADPGPWLGRVRGTGGRAFIG